MKEKWKKDKKFRRNCILAGLALVVLLGASVYTLFIQPNLSTETYVYKEETVVRGDLILGIMESGSLSLGMPARSVYGNCQRRKMRRAIPTIQRRKNGRE